MGGRRVQVTDCSSCRIEVGGGPPIARWPRRGRPHRAYPRSSSAPAGAIGRSAYAGAPCEDRQCCRWTGRRRHGAMSPGGPPRRRTVTVRPGHPCHRGMHRPKRRGWGHDDRPGESDPLAGGDSHQMRRPPRRAFAVTGVCVVLLAGCSGTSSDTSSGTRPGNPSDDPRQLVDASAEQLPIVGATDSPVDRLARNAIADLETFWAEAFPVITGRSSTPRRRLLLRRQLRPRRGQIPAQRHRLPGTPARPGGSRRERPVQPPAATPSPTTGRCCRISPAPTGTRCRPSCWPTSSAMPSRDESASRPADGASRTRRRPTASREPGRPGSTTARRGTFRSTSGTSTASCAATSSSVTRSAATRTTARPTGRTSTGSRRSPKPRRRRRLLPG